MERLEVLIPAYASNKQEMDSYKKLCDKENKEIKKLMKESKINEFEAGGYTAKFTIQKRESMNEDKLLELCRQHGLSDVIKTKEYVDMDALESAIYKSLIQKEIILEMDKCREVKEVEVLKVSKTKNGE